MESLRKSWCVMGRWKQGTRHSMRTADCAHPGEQLDRDCITINKTHWLWEKPMWPVALTSRSSAYVRCTYWRRWELEHGREHRTPLPVRPGRSAGITEKYAEPISDSALLRHQWDMDEIVIYNKYTIITITTLLFIRQ